jgi:hypothetical protein
MILWAFTAFAADKMYVQASTLNLRASPDANGAVRASLPINTAVEVLAVQGALSRVRANGQEGWVTGEFLAAQPLTVEAAMAQAAARPADKLSWLQRAAAIRPDAAVLAALEAEYRARGDTAAADKVARQRKWPSRVFLVASANGELWISLSPEPGDQQGHAVSEEDFVQRFGFSPRAQGWVLPSHGPAVRAQLDGARVDGVGYCGNDWETVATLKVELPGSAQALAFTPDAEPPASWRKGVAEPGVPEAKAREVAMAQLAKSPAVGRSETRLWPTPDGWLVSVSKFLDSKLVRTSLLVSAGGTREISDWTFPLLAARDVSGDGSSELVMGDDCERWAQSLDGERLSYVSGLCCD